MIGRGLHRFLREALEIVVRVDDGHGPAAEHVGRAHEHGIADAARDLAGLGNGGGGAALRLRDLQFVEELREALAVLGEVDHVGRRAPDGNARAEQGQGELERGLAAELDDHAVGLLALDDVHDVFEGERLEVEAIGGVVVGRDRLGVAVDHEGLAALLVEGEARVAAAVVELDALADAVGAAAEDHDLAPRGRVGLALVLVGRVEVRGVRLELGRAGVDALVDRGDAEAPCASRGHRTRRCS